MHPTCEAEVLQLSHTLCLLVILYSLLVILQVAFGNGHQLSELNCFLPFSLDLPFELASAIAQAASAITTEKAICK